MLSFRQQMEHKKAQSKGSSKKKKKLAPENKKLTEKGKAKLADIRAKQMLEKDREDRLALQDENTLLLGGSDEAENKNMAPLLDDKLSDQDKLIILRQQALNEIEEEEYRKRISKLQSKHNAYRNAQRQGQKMKNFDWAEEESKLNRKKVEEAEILHIVEPIKIIKDLLEAGCIGQKPLTTMLEDENTQRHLHGTDLKILKASLDATMNGRKSPLNFRVEMIWRFGSTIADFRYVGSRALHLKLAIYCFNLLLEKCTQESHPFHYAAIHNSLEQAEYELDRVEGSTGLSSVNREKPFIPPKESDFMFNFQRKSKKKKEGGAAAPVNKELKERELNPAIAAAEKAKAALNRKASHTVNINDNNNNNNN